MRKPRTEHVTERARRLRREMTDEEHRLWWYLCDRFDSIKWRRQEPIGPFIADFACYSHRLVVEADGSHHTNSDWDENRDRYMMANGWRVLRIANHDIAGSIEDVVAAVAEALDQQHTKQQVRCNGWCLDPPRIAPLCDPP